MAGGLQEQAGEKLDRLGLLVRAQAGKPGTAEPNLGIAQNDLLQMESAPGREHPTRAAGAKKIPL